MKQRKWILNQENAAYFQNLTFHCKSLRFLYRFFVYQTMLAIFTSILVHHHYPFIIPCFFLKMLALQKKSQPETGSYILLNYQTTIYLKYNQDQEKLSLLVVNSRNPRWRNQQNSSTQTSRAQNLIDSDTERERERVQLGHKNTAIQECQMKKSTMPTKP